MNIIKRMYSLIPVVVLLAGLALILIPVPMKFIEVLIVLDYLFAISLFLIKLVNRNKLNWYPKFTVIFSVVTCGIAIAAARTFLITESLEDQICFVRITGQWLCRENCVCGFFITFMMCTAVFFFCKKCISDTAEVSARVSLDGINNSIFSIQQEINNGKITEDEGDVRIKEVQNKIDYYSGLAHASKYILNTIKVFAFLLIIVTAGGIASGIIEFKMFWEDAVKQFVMLSCGCLAVFVIPIFLVSLSLKIR